MSLPRTSRRSPRISPAPAPRQTSPAARIRRPIVGCASASARKPAISAGLYGFLARSLGSGISAGYSCGTPPADEPQVRAQRPPRRAGQAGRAPGEPLGHRRVQHRLRRRIQAQPERIIGEPARRHSRFFARSRPCGSVFAITSRANAAACGDTDDGRHRPI